MVFKQSSKVSKPANRLIPGKCQLITSSKAETEVVMSNSLITMKKANFLGIHVDGNLNFDYHVNQICKKSSKKIHTLTRICK